MDKFVIENEPRVDLPEISSIQAMVISEKDVKRGGLITDCLVGWYHSDAERGVYNLGKMAKIGIFQPKTAFFRH